MLTASATIDIDGVSSQDVLEYVLDLEQYMEADHKITKVRSVTGPDADGNGSAKIAGKLKFGPAAPDVQNFKLDRWSRLTFTGAPKQPGRLVFSFVGTFDCEPIGDAIRVTHAYEFTFTPPFRWLEAMHRDWMQAEVEAEMARVKAALEAST